ncbi:MAG TPA: ABC transporter permease, partial [Accumulibacter sp.]
LINLPKRGSGKPSNVTVRGTSEAGGELRPQVRLSEGRMFRRGTSEIVAGSAVVAGFQGVGLGQTLRFAGRDWLVVGVLDAGRSGFDSELWGDSEQMLQAFRRTSFSTVVLRLADENGFESLRQALEDDPRLALEAKPERVFYAEQSEALATFIRLLGSALAVVFSIGAVVGAMITMFAAVAARSGEIGTLRALGFRRSAVLLAFLGESLLLAVLGGALGLLAASAMQAFDISTTNFQTFAELAFRFVLTPTIAVQAMAFALAMGVVGGVIPAWRAARLEIAECLRAV